MQNRTLDNVCFTSCVAMKRSDFLRGCFSAHFCVLQEPHANAFCPTKRWWLLQGAAHCRSLQHFGYILGDHVTAYDFVALQPGHLCTIPETYGMCSPRIFRRPLCWQSFNSAILCIFMYLPVGHTVFNTSQLNCTTAAASSRKPHHWRWPEQLGSV